MELAVSKGALREDLERLSGLRASDIDDQDRRVPFENYAALMRAGKALSGDPALALHFGEAADLGDMSIVGLIGAASTSMLDGLAQLNRYSRLVVDVEIEGDERFKIVRDTDGPWLVDMRLNPNAFPEQTESTFARMASGARRRSGASLAKAVQLTHADPGYRDEYQRIFGAPVTFDCKRNALLVDDEWLAQKPPQQSRYVFGILSVHANALLEELTHAKSLRAHVEALILPGLHCGDMRVEKVASGLGMSRWTLARRLKEEGTTFERVLDDLRRRMAMHYLSSKKVSVNEAAYLVGFSEAPAFSRAFKRWTGESPRKALRSDKT